MASAHSTVIQNLILFLKGLAMGTANKVPGVSGGAVAFVLGFYEELIYTFQKINIKAFKLLISGRFKSLYNYLNLRFLLLVMGGSLFSYFSVSLVLDYLLKNFEIYVWGAFFGMIIGSVIYISKKYENWNLKNISIVVLGVLIGLLLSFMPPAKENSNLWFVFFCGVIGVSGMTLPGLSGSFLLILLGNYVLLLVDSVNVVFEVAKSMIEGDYQFLQNAHTIKYLKIAVTFFFGSLFGLISISHILGYVLKRWNHIVTALIIGFITGSLGMVWPWKYKIYKMLNEVFVLDQNGNKILQSYERFIPSFKELETWGVLLVVLLGIMVVLVIESYEKKRI